MAVNHRKLVIESIRQETIEYCKPFCDPLQNPKGLCPISCFSVCISRCYNQIVDLIPPPPEILPPADPPHHHRKLSLSLTIFISILAVTFFLFFCFTIYKCKAWYRGRSRRSTNLQPQLQQTNEEFFDEDHGFVMDHPIWYIRTIGLQPSVISAISIYEYKAGEGLVEGTECSVCLNEFQEHETLRLLPKCNHAFHIPCIDTWLRSHTNCPLCRAGIISNVAGNLPALPPPPEQIIDTSNVLDNTQMGTSVNNSENGSESEEEEGESREENEIKRNEIDKEIGDVDQLEENEVQPMRRSFSVDFSLISSAEFDAKFVQSDTKNSASRMVKADELNRGSSSGRSLQKGPVLMKRSVSYSGKVLFSSNSNSHSKN